MAETSALVSVVDQKHNPDSKPENNKRQVRLYKYMFGIQMEPIKPPYKHPFLNTDTFD